MLLSADPRDWLGDIGYIGNNMITPFRKPEGSELLDWQKEFNKQVNKIRYVIEQVIANFETWRIMHTDYRRPPGNILRNHLSSSRPVLLRNRLNNPHGFGRAVAECQAHGVTPCSLRSPRAGAVDTRGCSRRPRARCRGGGRRRSLRPTYC